MKRIIFLLACFLSGHAMLAQSPPRAYALLVKKADSLYNLKDFVGSGSTYTLAMEANGWKASPTDRYNAACSWALAAVPDSAFYQLDQLVTKANYSNYGHISTDADLDALHKDARWKPLLEQVRKNKETAEANFNKPLVAMLDSVFYDDQHYRQQLDSIGLRYGRSSKEMMDCWQLIRVKDSINLVIITRTLDAVGWLGTDVIGAKGNATLFLVIQHADLATQQKYLPMMRAAVKNGKALASSLALLEDRVALGQGKKQIYGSQVSSGIGSNRYHILPLEDPDNVDKRRAAVGLEPLADYLANWQIQWDVEQYKKDLQQWEPKAKLTN